MTNLNRSLVALLLGTAWAIAPGLAFADPILDGEVTSSQNDTFATREILPPGTTYVIGELGLISQPTDYDYSFSGELEADSVNDFSLSDLPPGEPFFAWIDNSSSGVDTVLGTFDANDALLNSDDDSSPLGIGLASAIGGTVNDDGTINLKVTGFPDFDFDGLFDQPDFGGGGFPGFPGFLGPEGDFEVYIQLDETDIANVDLENPDYTFSGTLLEGVVVDFDVDDLDPSTPFVVWIDNSMSGVDTVLGTFDPDGELLDSNDDGSPAGDGLGSALTGTVNDDGTISLRVTAYPDFDFDGEYTDADDGFGASEEALEPEVPVEEVPPMGHGAQGDYELYVKLGIDSLTGDVDYFTFTGLEPGSNFVAEITLGNLDSVLGWLDAEGNIILVDDDGGQGFLSRVEGIVPDTGEVNLAVSSFDDFELDGNHNGVSDYLLNFEVNP